MRRARWFFLLAALFVLALIAIAFQPWFWNERDDEPAAIGDPPPGSITFELTEVNGSNRSGTATLAPREDGTLVALELNYVALVENPADVRNGTCAAPGSEVMFELEEVRLRGGDDSPTTSETILDVRPAELRGLIVAVREPNGSARTPLVACGRIPR